MGYHSKRFNVTLVVAYNQAAILLFLHEELLRIREYCANFAWEAHQNQIWGPSSPIRPREFYRPCRASMLHPYFYAWRRKHNPGNEGYALSFFPCVRYSWVP